MTRPNSIQELSTYGREMPIPIKINENHKRVIQTTLTLFDQMLCSFEKWASRQEACSVLYEEVNPLTDEQCQTLTNEIKEIRSLIITMREELELSKTYENIAQSIHAMSLIFISDDLLSLKKEGLEHYGEENVNLFAYLEPKAIEFIERLECIAHIGLDATKNQK